MTAIETSLVELLLRRSPNVLTRRMIATQVWEDEADAVGSNTIDVHVGRVRSKLAGSRARIETVRGTGYRMVESVNVTRAHRRHAVRVAAVATLIVMVGYVIAAVVLNLIVTNHLVGTTDTRLHDRLKDASRQTLTLPGTSAPDEQTDLDDAPLFLWSIAPSGDGDPADADRAAAPLPALGRGPGHARPSGRRPSGSTRCGRTAPSSWRVRARPRRRTSSRRCSSPSSSSA